MPADLNLIPAPLFDPTDNGRAFVPTKLSTAGERRRGPGRPPGRRASALPWTASPPPACWRLLGTFVLALSCVGAPACAGAANQVPFGPAERDRVIIAAAIRFGLPASWISAVIDVESGFDPRAVSRAGAMGLMQVMPKTYEALRIRHGLGADPFHPRDNVQAGAAYLRELYDRFGAPGFLAAYNAGPERYRQHVVGGRPLRLETRRYLARLAPRMAAADLPPRALAAPPATVFVRLRGRTDAGGQPPSSLFAPLTPRSAQP